MEEILYVQAYEHDASQNYIDGLFLVHWEFVRLPGCKGVHVHVTWQEMAATSMVSVTTKMK